MPDFYPKLLDDGMVRLATDPVRWQKIPKWLQARLIKAIGRVSKVRKAIAKSAKVANMPPVEVVAELWDNQQSSTPGMATPMQIGNTFYNGVRLAAQTVLYKNDEFLRAVLVHEFAHCFYYITDFVKRLDSGLALNFSWPEFDPFNKADDEAHMVNLSEWFIDEDVKKFMPHDDSRIMPTHKIIEEFKDRLPVVMPKLNYEITGQLGIEDDVYEHIKRLQK